jgi:transcription-repair coupling factor (superfamily II helicase)
VSLGRLLENWVAVGYRPVEVVEEPGTFSRRGGIVDLFPPNERWPVRIELFGDEIDSMRQFDPSTQRSIQQVTTVVVAPASEGLPKYGPAAAARLAALDYSTCHPVAESDYRRDRELLAAGQMIRGIEFYLPYLYSQPGRLLDYLPDHGLLIVEESAELDEAALEVEAQAEESRQTSIRSGDLPNGFARALWSWSETKAMLESRLDVELGYEPGSASSEEEAAAFDEMFSHASRYGGRLKQIVAECNAMTGHGDRVVVVSRQARRLVDLFNESGRPQTELEQLEAVPPAGSLSVVRGLLSEGWVLTSAAADDASATVLLTDTELFGWSKPAAPSRRKARGIAPESFFSDISPGDYVVHIEHGIGVFRGLVRMPMEGVEREYLQVDYAAGDRLYVPVNQADRLARYVGAGEAGPALNRLGTADWELVKERTRRAVRDIARELLRLYAARATVQGHAFQPDTPWQIEMEEAFPYIETADQLAAIEEVKTDMEQPRPMDRLICGDVGYGKTEVALRSAFKAVMDGKQVAVLVPTTVLAQQHYKRFQERLAAFPVQVEMLSRFRSEKDQERILSDLAAGKIDIIIGTHRLIQKDVKFRDLGLVIIDEEQRFGVAHKERLKQLRNEVDVLTLTATPIPRTLYMSLSGVRDMSTIDTPPDERLPIKTVLTEYDDNIVRQAILRELERGGQVYFVHNRVQGIDILARKLRKLVPEASFAVAHGQMPEKDLAQVMWDFSNGEFDVLVCTTIIESGIDIPNVNTIIVNQADHFGLSQLYQLRGRVGRGAQRAYAYLLYDRNQPLSEVARRRLEAIVEANELGAGFRIAMEDLEIRGAGELLGERQHGHIAAVGLDLYSRMLAQAVRELREGGELEGGEAGRELAAGRRMAEDAGGVDGPLVLIDLPLKAYLPATFVAEESLRLQLYRRLAEMTTHNEVDEIATELRDRFGPLPEEVENLLYQLRLKATALQLGVQAIVREDGHIVIRAPALEHADREVLQRRLGSQARVMRRQIVLSTDDTLAWKEALPQILAELATAGG